MTPNLCLMGAWRRKLRSHREAPADIVATVNGRAIQFADAEVYAMSHGDAEAALAKRDSMNQAGEAVGPRALDPRVVTRPDPDSATP